MLQPLLPKALSIIRLAFLSALIACLSSCEKDEAEVEKIRPIADFTYINYTEGLLPARVQFSSTAKNATSVVWDFGNGTTSTEQSPEVFYDKVGTYQVKLTAIGEDEKASVVMPIVITLNKPYAAFTIELTDQAVFPITMSINNITSGSEVSYAWTFGNESSSLKDPSFSITKSGRYDLRLVATNAAGSSTTSQQISISPYEADYSSFDLTRLKLSAWEGEKVVILSRRSDLNRASMFKWVRAMDAAYKYYQLCNGREPTFVPNNMLNGRTIVADVPTTCGAGCGYLGSTGIEMQNTFFDVGYNAINNNNQLDQIVFYEFGRNFWFCGRQLAYKVNDPVTTGYAVFMRFMAINAAGLKGAPFGALTFEQFQISVAQNLDLYLKNPSLNWENTLGTGKGVPGGFGGAADLFAAFCFKLTKDYGGETFVQSVWKEAAKRPEARDTQGAVDNFFLASCAAAKKNLTELFKAWRWPLSTTAINAASQYP